MCLGLNNYWYRIYIKLLVFLIILIILFSFIFYFYANIHSIISFWSKKTTYYNLIKLFRSLKLLATQIYQVWIITYEIINNFHNEVCSVTSERRLGILVK